MAIKSVKDLHIKFNFVLLVVNIWCLLNFSEILLYINLKCTRQLQARNPPVREISSVH